MEDLIKKIEALGFKVSCSKIVNYTAYSFTKTEEDNDLLTVVDVYKNRCGEYRINFERMSSKRRKVDLNGTSLSKEELLLFTKFMEEVSK